MLAACHRAHLYLLLRQGRLKEGTLIWQRREWHVGVASVIRPRPLMVGTDVLL